MRCCMKHFLIVLILGISVDLSAQNPELFLQYQVKAAFLYKFIKFVDWPEGVLPDTCQTISIGVLSRGPIHRALDLIADKEVKGRQLVVKHFPRLQDIEYCHVLFIGGSEKKHLKQILKRLNGNSTLTVSEIEGFGHLGGMINFIFLENRIGFEINPNAAEETQLKISSKLLRLAKIVGVRKFND